MNKLECDIPSVAIVVLAWNHRERTLKCLNSVRALEYPHGCVQVVLVDNASTDGTVEVVREKFPEVRIIANKDNLGYATGNNIGIKYALDRNFDYVFIVNNDIVLDNNALSQLVQAAERNPVAGFLGPKIYQSNPPTHIQSAGTVVDKWGRSYQRGLDQPDIGQFDLQQEIDAIVGCATLVRRDVLERIGLLNERFYLYREDIDWCLRTRRAGYKILYVPSARVWHRSSNARESDLGYIHYYMVRNRYLLLTENGFGIVAIGKACLQHLLWLANWSINPKWRHKRALRDATFKALVDALLGRYGEQPYRYGL